MNKVPRPFMVLRVVKMYVLALFWLSDHYFLRFFLKINRFYGFYGEKTYARDLVSTNIVIWLRSGHGMFKNDENNTHGHAV